MSFIHSKYQEACFDWVKNGKGHAIINATAGSSKTYTLCECMKITSGNAVFLAFNKSIADELQKKVPSHVKACTLHSLGFSAIRWHFGKTIVDGEKLNKIMDGISGLKFFKGMNRIEWKETNQKRSQIKRLVSLVKMSLIDPNNNEAIAEQANFYGIEYDENILSMFRHVFEKSVAIKYYIDFDDMIYFPVHYQLSMLKYDWVFVDESQDLNRTQIELVLSIVKPKTGRVVAVGDPKQSIYGFRGADSEAMNRIKNALNAIELPLSVCYRCPTSHIKLAQELVPHIEAAPSACEGEILNLKEDLFDSEIVKDKNPLVLCRINAPLMQYALALIAKGIKATIKGRDIGKSLLTIIDNIEGDSIEDIYAGIRNWENRELEKLYKKNAPDSMIETVKDKADTLEAIADSCDGRNCVVRKIETIFTDDKVDGVEFSSVHKAKGLQADAVYIIKPELMPLIRKNQKDWEYEQELNIKYVALTRSKNKLVFVKK